MYLGKGKVVTDIVSKTTLQMVGEGRPKPQWMLCSRGALSEKTILTQPEESIIVNMRSLIISCLK